MVEPIGTLSGVLGVAEVGFSLAATLYKYASSVKSAEKELKAIAKDVELTSKVLKQTHEQIQKDQKVNLCSSEALELTSDVLSGCQDAFREVDEALKGSIGKDGSLRDKVGWGARMKWPLKSGKLDVLRANLEKLKTTLLLMLSVLAYGRKVVDSRTSAGETRADLSLDKLQIQNLVEARDEATRRYEEMSAAFAKIEARLDANASGASPVPPPPPPPAYSASTHQTAMSVIPPPPPVPASRDMGTRQLSAAQSAKPTNMSADARVSDCLGICASAVYRLAATIEEATHRWHNAQILEHDTVSESLKAAIEAVATLGDEGKHRPVPASTTPLIGKIATGYGSSTDMNNDSEPRLDSTFERQKQISWRATASRYAYSSSTYIPPPPPRYVTQWQGTYIPPPPPPPPRATYPTAHSHSSYIEESAQYEDYSRRPLEHSTVGTHDARACLPEVYADAMPELSGRYVPPLEWSTPYGPTTVPQLPNVQQPSSPESEHMLRKSNALTSRQSTFDTTETQPPSLNAKVNESDIDDSDDGLFALPVRRAHQQTGNAESQNVKTASGSPNDSGVKFSSRPQLSLKSKDLFSTSASFSSDTWGHLPPSEAVLGQLDTFFPDVDLDQPASTVDLANRDETVTDSSDSDSVPERIDGNESSISWTRGHLIGRSLLGRTYFAIDKVTKKLMTVKEVEIDTTDIDERRVREFLTALGNGIKTSKELKHASLIQYLGFELHDNRMSIFQEYFPGRIIGSLLRKYGKFEDEALVSFITRQTLYALSYLHTNGSFHGELKADTILLGLDGTCKLTDFGISNSWTDMLNRFSNDTAANVFWMAPEVIRAVSFRDGEIGVSSTSNEHDAGKADIWSLGCVVLEMFSGHRPLAKEEAIGAIYKLGSLKQAPPIPDDVSTTLSPEALASMYDCFTVDPDERPDAQALLSAPFCRADPNFDFKHTALYAKLMASNVVEPNGTAEQKESSALSLTMGSSQGSDEQERVSRQIQERKRQEYLDLRRTRKSGFHDFDTEPDRSFQQEEQLEHDVVDDLLHRWTTVAL